MATPKSKLSKDDAESIALQVLAFLLADPKQISRFLALTGIEHQELRDAAASGDLQAATLEYLLGDEALLLSFCQEAGVDPAIIAPSYALLTGPVFYD